MGSAERERLAKAIEGYERFESADEDFSHLVALFQGITNRRLPPSMLLMRGPVDVKIVDDAGISYLHAQKNVCVAVGKYDDGVVFPSQALSQIVVAADFGMQSRTSFFQRRDVEWIGHGSMYNVGVGMIGKNNLPDLYWTFELQPETELYLLTQK